MTTAVYDSSWIVGRGTKYICLRGGFSGSHEMFYLYGLSPMGLDFVGLVVNLWVMISILWVCGILD